ncbi:class I SAM-dependent methyltransferase [Rhodoferax saidenbachensis]|uniref:SAM-dependent methyltransferase n=1 Tax=Rhodoferax saidenbachensis TaxID=1484693 RepID=A0A1P8KFZ0_9BURK|nr:class I SAM-dependent methyltransferase [Rhodoferax saidenbachensis]APW44984.1 SAM-dependent methyltransferase [Rhodoferax saidenbachensis]
MNIYQADIQLAAAKHLRWMPDSIVVEEDRITVSGWALSVWDSHDQRRVLINGVDFEQVAWSLASPDLLVPFGDVPGAAVSRFHCWHRKTNGQSMFPEGFARLNVTGRFGEHRLSYRTAWYVADPAREQDMPSLAQIERVIGNGDQRAFLLGGATIVKRFEQLLLERFERPLSSFESILDWGCGAGRLSRYLSLLSPSVTGIDIDADNIASCARTIPGARFMQVDLMPPTSFPEAAFDLVLGLSVLTHLDEVVQDAWLAELRRITRPNALLMLSVQGLAQMALYRTPPELHLEVHRSGFFDAGANSQLQEVVADASYYRNVMHSPDYIMVRWSRWFDVLDIIEGTAGNQDVVLLRRRTDD